MIITLGTGWGGITISSVIRGPPLLALVVISIWKFAGYYMIFFLAGLQAIPDDAMEAAHIEGGLPLALLLAYHSAAVAPNNYLLSLLFPSFMP